MPPTQTVVKLFDGAIGRPSPYSWMSSDLLASDVCSEARSSFYLKISSLPAALNLKPQTLRLFKSSVSNHSPDGVISPTFNQTHQMRLFSKEIFSYIFLWILFCRFIFLLYFFLLFLLCFSPLNRFDRILSRLSIILHNKFNEFDNNRSHIHIQQRT